MNTLKLEATAENLNEVIDFVGDFLSFGDFAPQTVSKAKIAAEEIFINICRYAYTPETGNVEIRADRQNDSVCVEFEDGGRPFNPLSDSPEKDLTKVSEGGYGIFMAQNLVSEISYQFINHKNVLKIIIK